MDRRNAVFGVLALGAATPFASLADQPRTKRQHRIGLLPDLNPEQLDWFVGAMNGLGWTAGRDFVFVESGTKFGPHAEPAPSRMVVAPARLYQEGIGPNTRRLLSHSPDLILATSTAYAVAAHRASATVPVVMWTGGYPVEAGIANSLAHPGKNVTGASIYAGTGIWGKLVELLRLAKPGIRTVGVLWDYLPPAFPAREMELCYAEFRNAESMLGLKVHVAQVADADQLEQALDRLTAERAEALVATSGWGLIGARQLLMDYALARRLPVIVDFEWRSIVDPYPLLVYGASQRELMRSAAGYVAKIFQGTRPGDLPVLQPARFELIVNLQTARRIGLDMPRSLLVRADRVTE